MKHCVVRTCVGCRQRASAAELLRVVSVEHGAQFRLVPDPGRRLPGRGAHVHPRPACVAIAERRRAFGRALRVTGVLDSGRLADHVALGTADGGPKPNPDKLGRTTHMSTR
jgi:predicted RNA-binding protein YlxR (DUF448 family)